MIVNQSDDDPQSRNLSTTHNSAISKQQENSPQSSVSSIFSGLLSRFVPGLATPSADAQRLKNQNNSTEANSAKRPKEAQQAPLQTITKRACRAPLSRKFAHPCTCQSSNQHKLFAANANNGTFPPSAYSTPVHLYDSVTKKCLPTSRNRDMLLRECRSIVASPYPLPHQLYHTAPCVYDDLVCDARRNRCVCKPSLHLYYESSLLTFGCVPIVQNSSDNRVVCRSGQVYNVISRECQKIFDINELPPNNTTGVSATQFSFVTIVLIWILLLILIVTAKLRKLRASNLYRNSPSSERRPHHRSSQRHYQNQSAAAWLHPFIAAVNGHHHAVGHHRSSDRQTDDPGNFNDTDFFLARNQRMNGLLTDADFSGSQLSLNNPPKFEEIYPSCPQSDPPDVQPPPNEDLPSYEEAMKLQNTIPPIRSPKE